MKLAGKLLIAMPRMGDARFEGTLILVCVHSEEGAMGLIVNRARRDVSFPQLLAAMGIETTGSARPIRVQVGGPVQPSCGFVLHGEDYGTRGDRADGEIEGGEIEGGEIEGGETEGSEAGLHRPGRGGPRGEDPGSETLSDGTRQVAAGFRMTTAQDVLEALGAGGGPREAVLMLGYAGWGPGQIEAEIARNDWLTADARPDLVFAPGDEGKWTAALRSLGVDPLALSSMSGRA